MTTRTDSLLGLSGFLDADRIDRLVDSLSRTWEFTLGRPTGELESDLEACRRWFDPVAQGQRLRRELGDLPDLPPDLLNPGAPLIAEVSSSRRLVTPEGRCALELLRGLPENPQGHLLIDADLLNYDRLLGITYRSWSRHRINSVLELLAGTTKPLQVPAAGVVIALLVDRCTSAERALVRYSPGPVGSHVVERAFFSAVHAFADVLAPSRKRSRDQRLISGWMLYEARRRLGDALVLEGESSTEHEGKVWIRAEAEDEVVAIVARDLARGHRARITADQFEHAFDALVRELRLELPGLAAFGMAHERPTNTKRLRQRFLDALATHLGASHDASDLGL